MTGPRSRASGGRPEGGAPGPLFCGAWRTCAVWWVPDGVVVGLAAELTDPDRPVPRPVREEAADLVAQRRLPWVVQGYVQSHAPGVVTRFRVFEERGHPTEPPLPVMAGLRDRWAATLGWKPHPS